MDSINLRDLIGVEDGEFEFDIFASSQAQAPDFFGVNNAYQHEQPYQYDGQHQTTGSQVQEYSLSLGLSQGTLQAINEDGEEEYTAIEGTQQYYADDGFMPQNLVRSIIGNKFGGKKIYESEVEDLPEFGQVAGIRSSTADEQEEEISSSQSSDISQESTIPPLTQYPGKYNFQVVLGANHFKKAGYAPDLNKLFCVNNQQILFNFSMDCKPALMKELTVKSMLVYSDNAHIIKPVEICITCLITEAGTKDIGQVDPDSIVHHVLRCSHEQAVYERNGAQKRYTVSVPMEKPQVGSDWVSRNYEFKCMNTCKGIGRRATTLFFLLMESGRQVGRCVMDIKVCKCPKRDLDNEVKKMGKKKIPDKILLKRPADERLQGAQLLDPDADEKNLVDKAPKQRCVALPSMAGLRIKSEPGQRQALVTHQKTLLSQSQSDIEQMEQSELEDNSQASQESVCTSTMKKVEKDVRLFFEMNNSPNEEKRSIAKAGFALLKLFHAQGNHVRKFGSSSTSSGNSPTATTSNGSGYRPVTPKQRTEDEDHGSPDSGVNTKTP